MKHLVLIFGLSVSALTAGIPSAKSPLGSKDALGPKSAMEPKSVMPPPPSGSLIDWFIGGSGGYLLDNDEDMWHLHLGVDLSHEIAGFSTSIFLEAGWAQFEGRAGTTPAVYDTELNIIPITINGKLERELFGPVNFYLGGGLGIAALDLDYSAGANAGSADEVVFAAQVFAGLVVNLTPTFELFAGARWIYLDQPDFDIGGMSADLDYLGISNDDVLLEAGGRVNF